MGFVRLLKPKPSDRTGRPRSRWRTGLRAVTRRIGLSERGSVMVEFAVVAPVFFLLLFFTFDTAYTFFLQGVLDTALQTTARAIQVGLPAAQASTTGQLVVSNLLCPDTLGLVNCNNLYVRVERVDESVCPGVTTDVWNDTNGQLPSSGGVLGLSAYSSENAASGVGTTPTGSPGPGTCDSNKTFCFAEGSTSSSSSELIILSAVYVTNSFLGGLAPSPLRYNGSIVRAMYSQSSFITEHYTSTTPTGVTAC